MSLRKELIKLAHKNPAIRADILPLLKEASSKRASINFDRVRREIEDKLGSVREMIDEYVDRGNTLTILIEKGESRRLGRAAGQVKITDANFDGSKITAHPKGSKGETYDTRITLSPKRGHHCTCLDWQQRGRSVGPCKHVLALALYWQANNIQPALESIDDRVSRVLEYSD